LIHKHKMMSMKGAGTSKGYIAAASYGKVGGAATCYLKSMTIECCYILFQFAAPKVDTNCQDLKLVSCSKHDHTLLLYSFCRAPCPRLTPTARTSATTCRIDH
jgi:hypothetical protein